MSNPPTPFLVQRSCTREAVSGQMQQSKALESYRDLPAYVLLGDPGAGKTRSFEREAEEAGGKYISAREFAVFEPETGLAEVTLFIDGLDEIRADGGDGRTPLDHIRKHLARLGKPRFRLSCRAADWLGNSDSEALRRVSPNGDVIALHLDPLNDDDINAILEHTTSVTDPEAFIKQAREYQLDELLRNPQTLNLLIEAVDGNNWPKSRAEIYQSACNQLVRENNSEHRAAKRENTPPTDSILDSAGYLCAIQLLAGLAGFSLEHESSSEQYVFWNDLNKPDLQLLIAIKSNLFHSDGDQLRSPVHRTVAEFLGASYLASQIEKSGLPVNRIMALITGYDGGIVPDLRGLAAWLAFHSRSSRRELIRRDPLAIVLYGDARHFPVSDKELVLEALGQEAKRYPWFRSGDWADSPFGALATVDMESSILRILNRKSYSDADQSLLNCVLDAIAYGEQIPSLNDALEAIIRDPGYLPYIHINCLDALFQNTAPDYSRQLQLAKDINDGIVEDSEDELMGALLKELYPNEITPANIFEYLHSPKSERLIGSYIMFWQHYLDQQTTNKQLPMLLDKLVKVKPVDNEVDDRAFDRFEGGLLARAIVVFGDEISDEQLYQWLGVCLDKYDFLRMEEAPTKRIATWFESRSERYRSLIEYTATQCIDNEEPSRCMWSALQRVSMVMPPENMDVWYMEKAASEQNTKIARVYFTRSIYLRQVSKKGEQSYLPLTELDKLTPWIEANPKFEQFLEPFVSCPIGDWEQENGQKKLKRNIEQQKRIATRLSFYREHIDEIRRGTAHPHIMHDLALAYDGHLFESQGETSQERMQNFLDNDNELIKAAYAGLVSTLERDDLPTVKEILKLAMEGRMHYIRSACLLGMELLYLSSPDKALSLPDETLSRLLTFRLTDGTGNEPEWFKVLAQTRTSLVAEAFLDYALPMLKTRKEHITGLHLLTHNNDYIEVARYVLPELLQGFPVRAGVKQLPYVLDGLLKGAFRQLDKEELVRLVDKKSSLKSMDAAQKVYWFTSGLLLKPEVYECKLFEFIGNNQKRGSHLINFLYESFGRNGFSDWVTIPDSTLIKMIELFGPDYPDISMSGLVTDAVRVAEMMSSYINQLGNNPDEWVSQEISRLLGLPELSDWHDRLKTAQYIQRIARRKASFSRLSVQQIIKSVDNLQPANAADLAAITLEKIRDIACQIRDGSTNDYRQYWSYEEKHQKIINPKPKSENDCRDALLSDLQQRLGKYNIDAQREVNYADDKRADIRVSYAGSNGFNIPVEIKKDTHKDLWTAMHNQLIAKYTRDPGTDGYGIYLVFWFDGKCKPHPANGKKPRSAAELEEWLTQILTPDERHRISVCVIDCVLPNNFNATNNYDCE